MPAVTQQIPNFLGGVSRQTDDKKLPNTLTECVNGYPDPTFGLLKRPGMRHINVLKKADGTAFSKTELADAAWFFIDRGAAGSYVGCIKGTDIYVWTAEDGTFCTVTNTGTAYLTGAKQSDYHFRSIQDVTIITNKTVTTAKQADATFVANSQATLKLKSLIDSDVHTIKIKGTSDGTERSTTATAQSSATFNSFLTGTHASHDLLGAIKTLLEDRQNASDTEFDGKWYLNSYANSIQIRRTTESNAVVVDAEPGSSVTYKYFQLSGLGGVSNDALETFQDEVTTIDLLPLESFHNHTVKILNSSTADDDYYLKFVAEDGVGGYGYWEETRARDVSPGLDNTTLPHELANTGATTFTFGPITYKERKTGDVTTNPDPSFVGKKIACTFFFNNRFGVLAEDNVVLGVANDNYNFFYRSALTQVDPDPVDLNVSSVRPVRLFEVLPSPQGLLLFSERQQFQLYASDASDITKATALIRPLSNYEMEPNVRPVDMGTTVSFISKVPGYSKVFSLALRDVEQTPIVVDISKAVLEWLPDTVDFMLTSPQNSLVMLIDRDTSYMYSYRFYNNGQEDLFQAWTKWEVPGKLQVAEVLNDDVTIVSQHEDQYTLGIISLDELPSGNVVSTSSSYTGNVPLDMATRPVKPHADVDAVVYDETNDITKIYVPYTPIDDKEAIMLLTVPTADDGTDDELDSDQGYWATAIERIEPNTNYRYFEVKGKFTDYADGIVVGYGYDLEVTMPKFYFQQGQPGADYTATLIINRIRLSAGRSGAIRFKIKPTGSNEWKDVQHTTEAGVYQGDTNPVINEQIFTLPIHQRNTNFELKVTSNFPYPVSLVSMMWEGNYSPRFYRRA
tara:strand:- start:5115 stop:7661 length:2547 start_codon:yes stop_codon:yes gene_type:complete